jgi:hypothetical protein
MNFDTPGLDTFIEQQSREWGAKLEVDAGLWALFGVEAANVGDNALARELLADVKFAHDAGSTEDDRWTLYYVDSANRPAAMHWLEDLHHQLAGEIRRPSPEQRNVIKELVESPLPHRIAQALCGQHAQKELAAGSVREPAVVRGLLDRLHLREPLFYAAFHQLLRHHLVDMIVMLQQIIAEDVVLLNETLSGSISRDPFLQSRQIAAAEIRRLMIEFSVINSLDQQKHTAIRNPYTAYMDLVGRGEELVLPLDGMNIPTARPHFVQAIHSIRRNLYLGGKLEELDTQAPWMRNDIAHSFRFIKRRLEMHRDLAPLDGLYMLERAVDG